MSPDGTYNGYANYQTWNVCLWISNHEGLNNLASSCRDYEGFKNSLRSSCEGLQCCDIDPLDWAEIAYETPDGVSWNDSGVNLAEMKEYWEENFSRVAA
jgi:hypothetical protein